MFLNKKVQSSYNYIPTYQNIPIKRWFLPFICLIGLVAIKSVRDFIYLPLLVSGVSFIVFWNFPCVVYITSTKPLYYEDLFIDEKKLPNYEIDEEIKNRFQNIFVWVLIFTNTFFVGILSDYWLYKTIAMESRMEIIGVTGGIIKIFQIVNNSLGRLMLTILRYYIKKASTLFNEEQRDNIENIVRLKRIPSIKHFQHIELTEKHKIPIKNITLRIEEI